MTNEQENQDLKEVAFQLADRYIRIQEADEGYDYTIYDMNYRELDGGVYDNPDITIRETLYEIELDLKEPMHRSELEGNINSYDKLIPIDFEELTEKVEYTEIHWFEDCVKKVANERRIIEKFKAKTSDMFHKIDGLTQEEIELNVYAYLQSKIDEYQISINIVGIAIYGSRCRGLEKKGSDLDIVVEYTGCETEDDLFNVFNEDGFMLGGIKVDINPITEDKTGTLGSYLQRAESLLMERQIIITYTVAECSEFHSLGHL